MVFCSTFYSWRNLKKLKHQFYKHIKQDNIFSIDIQIYIYIFLTNQHIRMISEGSCDTEDWNNDAEHVSFGHHQNKLHFKIY